MLCQSDGRFQIEKNNNYKHIIPTYYTQESLCKLEPVELALVPEATAGRPDTYHILRNQL